MGPEDSTEKRHEIAIIGGGIVGVSTAYFLAKQGLGSTIFDPLECASRASGLAYGGLNPVSGFGVPGPMWEIGEYSFFLHSQIASELQSLASKNCGFRNRDTLTVVFSLKELDALKTRADWINSNTEFDARILDGHDVLELESRASPLISGALLVQNTTETIAQDLCRTLAFASKCHQVRKSVVALKPNTHEVVITAEDETQHRANTVVCAIGPWVGELFNSIAIQQAIFPLKGQILRLKANGAEIRFSIGWEGNYCTTKGDGLVWAGTTEEMAGFDETTNQNGRKSILQNLTRVLPSLDVVRVVRQTACLRPMTIDGLLALGRLNESPNIILATGAGRKGILYGPAMGKVVADLIGNRQPSVEISQFGLNRFSV